MGGLARTVTAFEGDEDPRGIPLGVDIPAASTRCCSHLAAALRAGSHSLRNHIGYPRVEGVRHDEISAELLFAHQ